MSAIQGDDRVLAQDLPQSASIESCVIKSDRNQSRRPACALNYGVGGERGRNGHQINLGSWDVGLIDHVPQGS